MLRPSVPSSAPAIGSLGRNEGQRIIEETQRPEQKEQETQRTVTLSSPTRGTIGDQQFIDEIGNKLAEVCGEPMVDETDREHYKRPLVPKMRKKAVQLSFRRYHLPNGNVGRKFVKMLTNEINLVAEERSNSKRLIVFQVLILQLEMLVSKSSEVRCLIVRQLKMWEDGFFDTLMHDAERCYRSFGNGRDSKRREQAFEHTEKVFHRLIEGKF